MPAFIVVDGTLRPFSETRLGVNASATKFVLTSTGGATLAQGPEAATVTPEQFEGATTILVDDGGTTEEVAGDTLLRTELWVLEGPVGKGKPALYSGRYHAPTSLTSVWHGVGLLLPSGKVIAVTPAALNSRVYASVGAFVAAAIAATPGQLPVFPPPAYIEQPIVLPP
jgi:hypothetical protein